MRDSEPRYRTIRLLKLLKKEGFFKYSIAFSKRGLEWAISMFAQSLWGSFGQALFQGLAIHHEVNICLLAYLLVHKIKQFPRQLESHHLTFCQKCQKPSLILLKINQITSKKGITFLVCKYQTTFKWCVVLLSVEKAKSLNASSEITW